MSLRNSMMRKIQVFLIAAMLLLVGAFSGTAHAELKVHLKFDGAITDAAGGDRVVALVDGTEGENQYVAGVYGQGLKLSGTSAKTGNDYVEIQHTLTDEGTMALWFNAGSLYNYNSVIDCNAAENDWEMWVYGTGELAARQVYSSYYLRNFYLEANRWYHITWTWSRDLKDPSKVDNELYVDGELVATITDGPWIEPGTKVYLGGGNSGNDGADGIFDDFRIYDHALTAAEIDELMSGPRVVVQPSVLNLDEGQTGSYDISLSYSQSYEPTETVTVTVTADSAQYVSLNGQEAGASAELVFQPGSYGTPQTLQVEAIDDSIYTGDRTVLLNHEAGSADAVWNAMPVGSVQVDIKDDEDTCGDWGYAAMDFNQDCYVNARDFALFAEQWLTCTDPAELSCINLKPRAALIAHRGASYLAPENTIAAANLAWQLGADGVECDVYLSTDSRVMVIHDSTTERTAPDQPVYTVSSADSASLRKLDVGSWKGSEWANERIPFLEEILATVPSDGVLFIEIKGDYGDIEAAIRDVLVASGKMDRVAIISFNQAACILSKQLMPTVPVYWLSSDVQGAMDSGLDGVDASYDTVTQSLMDTAASLEAEVHSWTVNDPAQALRLQQLGVRSITTDRPGWLREQMD